MLLVRTWRWDLVDRNRSSSEVNHEIACPFDETQALLNDQSFESERFIRAEPWRARWVGVHGGQWNFYAFGLGVASRGCVNDGCGGKKAFSLCPQNSFAECGACLLELCLSLMGIFSRITSRDENSHETT